LIASTHTLAQNLPARAGWRCSSGTRQIASFAIEIEGILASGASGTCSIPVACATIFIAAAT
jgi:hypothetical protein